MRKYYPIWLRLKKTQVCEIEVNPLLFKRVIKAVIKEKYGDTFYKKELSKEKKIAKIEYVANENLGRIKFSLKIKHTDPLLEL